MKSYADFLDGKAVTDKPSGLTVIPELTSLIVAAIAPHVTYKNHDAEIAVMLAIRDAVQSDRDQHAKHIAEMSTPLLSHTRVEWIEGRPHKVTITSPTPTPATTSSKPTMRHGAGDLLTK